MESRACSKVLDGSIRLHPLGAAQDIGSATTLGITLPITP